MSYDPITTIVSGKPSLDIDFSDDVEAMRRLDALDKFKDQFHCKRKRFYARSKKILSADELKKDKKRQREASRKRKPFHERQSGTLALTLARVGWLQLIYGKENVRLQ